MFAGNARRTVALLFSVLLVPAGARAADPPVPAPPEKPRPRLVAQLGHSGGGINSVAFSSDGKHVLTGSWDKTAILWDTETGKELTRFNGHSDEVDSVAFAPDGKRVLTGSGDTAAILWDCVTGKQVTRFTGHTEGVLSVAFAPDGKRVLTGSWDKTATLWESETGKQLKRFQGHAGGVCSVAFAPDGKRVLTGGADNVAILWDCDRGKELKRFNGHTESVLSVAFSSDGKRVLTGSLDKTAILWDSETGKILKRFKGHADRVGSVAITPDGKRALSGSADATAILWDCDTGKVLKRFQGQSEGGISVAFAPDGQRVLTGSLRDTAAILWDSETGKELKRFTGQAYGVLSVTFAPDEKRLLAGGLDGAAILWDNEAGKELKRFKGHTSLVHSVAFSPDGKRVLTGSRDKTAILWETETGKELKRFKGHADDVSSVAFSSDGKRVLTASEAGTAILWDTDTGRVLKRFKGDSEELYSAAIAPDGKRVLTGGLGGPAILWDTESGKELKRLSGQSREVHSVAFSSNGQQVLTGGNDNAATLWDTGTGKELQRFKGHAGSVTSVAFSSDGKRVLTGSGDKTAILWDRDSGKVLKRFEGHAGRVYSVAFAPGGKWVLTGGTDAVILWDADTGKELCSLISFRDGGWAVVDPQGRFDASNGGDVAGLHWVLGDEPISLDQLKERYYDPGLLAKYLGHNKEPLRTVEGFTQPKLFPGVKVTAPTGEDAKLRVSLTNRGGGIGRVVVRVNGKELTPDARPRGTNPDAPKLDLPIDLTADPRLKPGEENVVVVEAFNAEGYLRSRGAEVRFVHRGQKNDQPPEVWVVAVGISKYASPALELQFAAKDAEDMAEGLRVAAGRLFGTQHLHLTLLTTAQEGVDHQPGRVNVVGALEAARKARPQDVLIVYLAGHGANEGGAEGDYYFLTADARNATLTDPEVRGRVAISSQQLADLLRQIPAQHQVLILDTCAAGRAVDKLTEKRDVPSSQLRALERVKDRTGTHVLAGCAADAVSYEATRYGQGVLTYSLLLGMRGGALKEDQHVDVTTLFNFASDRVPELARDIGGIQRPVVASPKGASFPIGLVTEVDQAKIPLRPARPLVLRGNFQEEESLDDVLGLARRVDERLRAASSRGGNGRVVFVDAREMPDAYRVVGRYRVVKGQVSVTLKLIRGKEKADPFEVVGEEAKPDELAAKIAAEIEKRLAAIGEKK